MSFIEANLETMLPVLEKLSADQKPAWGSMSAQRMVEHLTDIVKISTGENPQPLEVEEERIPRMQAFLDSDKPMNQNIEVPFAGKDVPLRFDEIELAVDELVDTWLRFEELFESNPGLTKLHPYYGNLNFDQWKRLHSKHMTHHFTQFGLL